MSSTDQTDPQRCLGCGMTGGRHIVTCEFYVPAEARLRMEDTVAATEHKLDFSPSQLDAQVGGNHYKKFGQYQPWEVFGKWLEPLELRGFMKGTVIAYLARQKNGHEDLEKAHHTLGLYLEIAKKEGKIIDGSRET